MEIKQVNNTTLANTFIQFPKKHYAGDPFFASPIDKVVENIFNPKVNPYFKHGKAERWLLFDNQKPIGRIAAFINDKKSHTHEVPTGGIGFYECIDDLNAAFMLFNTAKDWLSNNGMEAAEGPINFGENDMFWGLYIESTKPPSYGMNYHKKYYKQQFETYGFQVYYEQITRTLTLKKGLPERFFKIADWVMQKDGNSFEYLNFKEINKYTNDFTYIYNQAWIHHENFTPITTSQVESNFNQLKSIIVPEFTCFAYVFGEPAAVMVMVPDINQILIKLNGKLDFWGKLKFGFLKKIGTLKRLRIIVLGVVPKYQKLGLETGLIKKLYEAVKANGQFKEVELSWVGDFNNKMESLHKASGAEYAMKHITYKLMFNKDQTFKKPNQLK